jgi:hypothetical protein
MSSGKDGYAQLFFTQEDDATLHFGVMNGKPTSSMGSSAVRADYNYMFLDSQGVGVMTATNQVAWEVRNDETTSINTLGCKSVGGTDCYEYDETKQRAKAKWSWSVNENSGGMLGPLPSFNFCLKITAGDVNGIANYEFVSYQGANNGWPLVGQGFDSVAFDANLKICTYACPAPDTCVNPTPGQVGNSVGTTGTTAAGSASGSSSGSGGTGSSGSGSGSGSGDTGTTSSGTSVTSSTGTSSGTTGTTGTTGGVGGGGDNAADGGGEGVEGGDGEKDPGSLEEAGGIRGSGSNSTEGGGDKGEAGGMIGGVVGGIAGCLLVAVLVYVIQRKNKNSKANLTTSGLPKGWSMFIDPNTGYPCYVNDKTGDTQWNHPDPKNGVEMSTVATMENPLRQKKGGNHHQRASTQLPDGWDKKNDEEGNRYYVETETGETAWDAPEWDAPECSLGGSAESDDGESMLSAGHDRSETVLPSGWEHQMTPEGDKYYQEENTGETSWDPPEGSFGGSTGL